MQSTGEREKKRECEKVIKKRKKKKEKGVRSWQIHGSWPVLLGTQEVSRCGGDALQ